MSTAFFLALIAVVLALGVWIGICISDANQKIDNDLRMLLFAEKFGDELDREARRWQR